MAELSLTGLLQSTAHHSEKKDLMLEENTNASFHKLVIKSGFYSSLEQSTCFQFQSQAFLSLKKSGEADAD